MPEKPAPDDPSRKGLQARDVLGSWMEGPRAAAEAQGVEFPPRGARLGLPLTGSGSVAGVGRRLVALLVDWVLASVLVRVAGVGTGEQSYAWLVLTVFGVLTAGCLALAGRTPGHWLLRLQLVDLRAGSPLQPLRVLLRQVLVCLVIPAVIWDSDGRGLHDKAAGTVLVLV